MLLCIDSILHHQILKLKKKNDEHLERHVGEEFSMLNRGRVIVVEALKSGFGAQKAFDRRLVKHVNLGLWE